MPMQKKARRDPRPVQCAVVMSILRGNFQQITMDGNKVTRVPWRKVLAVTQLRACIEVAPSGIMSSSRDWLILEVSEGTQRFIAQMGFKRMTPVQAITIPLLLKQRDVAVEASWKTLAFLIPTFEIMCRALSEGVSRRPGSLQLMVGAAIIAPTRELATQIYEVFGLYLKSAKMELCERLSRQLCVGGSDAKGAAAALRRLAAQEQPPVPLHLVAATPGRLRALLALEETPLNMRLGIHLGMEL
eukprot:s90_g1.t1